MILYSRWVSLPLYVRNEIASHFHITKIGPTHVQDNRIVSDGYKIEDVERALNAEAIAAFLSSPEKDIAILFAKLIDRIEGRDVPPVLPEGEPVVEKPIEKPTEKLVEKKPKKKITKKPKK